MPSADRTRQGGHVGAPEGTRGASVGVEAGISERVAERDFAGEPAVTRPRLAALDADHVATGEAAALATVGRALSTGIGGHTRGELVGSGCFDVHGCAAVGGAGAEGHEAALRCGRLPGWTRGRPRAVGACCSSSSPLCWPGALPSG